MKSEMIMGSVYEVGLSMRVTFTYPAGNYLLFTSWRNFQSSALLETSPAWAPGIHLPITSNLHSTLMGDEVLLDTITINYKSSYS
jgi:hypothetical protein